MSSAQLIVKGVPAEIKQALAAEAADRDVTMTEVAVELLVDEFGGDWTPSGRPTLSVGASDDLVLRLPIETRQAVKIRAAETAETNRTVVLGLLARRYGLQAPEPQRRRRRQNARGS